MIHASPAAAFVRGDHVELQVVENNGQVLGVPIHPSVPCDKMLCDFPSWFGRYLRVGKRMTICNFIVDAGSDAPILRAKDGSLMPILHPEREFCRIAQALAGLGGWSFGLDLCRAATDMMVEVDGQTARAAADTHRCLLLTIDEALSMLKQGDLPTPFVLLADIKDHRVWVIAGLLNVGWWTASPPCPPWCSAATQLGLDSEEGEVFLHFISALGIGRAFGALLENVPGLPKHDHYPVLRSAFQECGLNLVVADSKPVLPVLPVQRKRWLAACIRHDLEIDQDRLRMAIHMGIPRVDSCFLNPCTMAAARCVQYDLQDWEMEQCIPGPEALDLMSQMELLPDSLKQKCPLNATRQEILQLRIRTVDQPLQPIMARQGSQHCLPLPLLREKGLLAYLLQVGDLQRFTTPYEVATCMGFPSTLVLPSDIKAAWKMVGNSLSVVHAAWHYMRIWPVVANAISLPGEHLNNHDLCQAVDRARCQLQDYRVCRLEEWMVLQPVCEATCIDPSQVEENDVIESSDDEPSPKRQCISPTWEFHAMEVDDPLVAVECEVGHIGHVQSPQCAALSLASCVLDPPPKPDAIPVRILHASGVWVIGFFTVGRPSVADILTHVLPHATADHFQNLWLNNRVACFSSRPHRLEFMSLVFQPMVCVRIVHAAFLDKPLSVAVDVTWKLCDLVAVVAANASVLPSQVGIQHRQVALDLQSFVLAHDLLEFECELVPQLAETLRPLRRDAIETLTSPVVPPVALSSSCDGLRFTVVDPKWGTAKSACLPKEATVEDLLCKLLPTYCITNLPVLSCGEIRFYSECRLADLPGSNLEIAFPHHGFPVGPVVNQAGNDPFVGTGDTLHLWIKGPFENRARVTKVPVQWSLLNVASHCLKDVGTKMTLMTLQGGRSIDPKLAVSMIDPNLTIEFRVCALPGGAKQNQNDVAAKLKTLLSTKGVADPSLAARAAMIMNKIPAADLQSILQKDGPEAWSALKKRATDAKLRMVTTQELHDFQRKQRDMKQASSSDASPKTTKVNKPKGKPTANQETGKLTIDLGHFHCEQGPLAKLDVSQWGPDRTGVTIATVDEASRLLPVTNLSMLPLALVVITPGSFAGQSPVAVPAVKENGLPTLASVVVLNFGDALVTCKPNVPKIELTPTPTCILEIFIERSLTTCWEDCQCPLTYLGLHLPEIRKQQVIASWAFSPYDSKRSKCKHAAADYWHGYVKIPEEHLSSTLTRSGLAGIFILVRTPEKRLDSNFGTVPIHGQTLEEVIKLSRSISDVLGVVQMGRKGPYALRGKREMLSKIRQQAIPQGITLQEGNLQQGGRLWSLRNVRTSTTCQGLTDALEKLGWPAFVVDLAGGASEVDTASVSTRLSDMKSDLEERLSTKLMSMMDHKFKACDDRINDLAASVDEVKMEVAASVSGTQKQLEDQSAAIQAQLKGNNDSIMHQMQSLFTKMQTELKETMTVEPSTPKRAKHT
eukprot:Skav201185  [mRNA]  locus=scaffold2736:225193:229740:+ [translate_table: standard]